MGLDEKVREVEKSGEIARGTEVMFRRTDVSCLEAVVPEVSGFPGLEDQNRCYTAPDYKPGDKVMVKAKFF